ncbi:MAG: transposase [Deltaproteobacteria bacterium]|nr:transposase [Deltaproteobacteria bacterium]
MGAAPGAGHGRALERPVAPRRARRGPRRRARGPRVRGLRRGEGRVRPSDPARIQRGRSTEAAKTLLGKLGGILVSDRYSAYGFWRLAMRQVCWAHLIRDFVTIAERGGDSARIGDGVRVHATGEDAARSASPAAVFLRSAARVPLYTPLRSSENHRRTGGPSGLLEAAFAAGNLRRERIRLRIRAVDHFRTAEWISSWAPPKARGPGEGAGRAERGRGEGAPCLDMGRWAG